MRRLVARRDAELQTMRRAGRVVAEMHQVIREAARPGITTAHLDSLARDVLERRGAQSNFLGYHGFPAVICGPGSIDQAHQPDEFVAVSEMEKGLQIFSRFLATLRA